VTTLAVDQHQRVIGVDAAQGRRQRQVGRVTTKALKVERGKRLGQNLRQVLLANALECLCRSTGWGGAVGGAHAGLARAGNDNFARRFGLIGLSSLHSHRRKEGKRRSGEQQFLHGKILMV
jgi:hypothetical protein